MKKFLHNAEDAIVRDIDAVIHHQHKPAGNSRSQHRNSARKSTPSHFTFSKSSIAASADASAGTATGPPRVSASLSRNAMSSWDAFDATDALPGSLPPAPADELAQAAAAQSMLQFGARPISRLVVATPRQRSRRLSTNGLRPGSGLSGRPTTSRQGVGGVHTPLRALWSLLPLPQSTGSTPGESPGLTKGAV